MAFTLFDPGPRQAVRTAKTQVAGLIASGSRRFVGLNLHPRADLLGIALVLAWLLGIAGDAWTTLAMMKEPHFMEGNPAAAYGMGLLTPGVFITSISILCLGFMILSLGEHKGFYSSPIKHLALAVLIVKVYIAASNYLLWAQVGTVPF